MTQKPRVKPKDANVTGQTVIQLLEKSVGAHQRRNPSSTGHLRRVFPEQATAEFDCLGVAAIECHLAPLIEVALVKH